MLVLGIVLFALGIVVSIVWHEYGHYRVALACGMKVRRFFVGFGPTVVSWRRGETQYGLAAIPLGGFCDIAGMTANDELEPDERHRAMHAKPAYQRIAVLLAGPMMNFILGFIIFLGVAVSYGLPNMNYEPIPTDNVPATVGAVSCLTAGCTDAGPAGAAGIVAGDTITRIDTTPITSWADISQAISDRAGDTVDITVQRGGTELTLPVTVGARESDGTSTGMLGVSLDSNAIPADIRNDPVHQPIHTYSGISALGGTIGYTGDIIAQTVTGIINFPAKIPGVVQSIFGGTRADDSPVSVVGASHIGGQVVEHGMWASFFLLLGALNFFIGGFNLIPLPPFDGGHIAVVLWEKIRDFARQRRGLAPAGPANYDKLMPLTMGVFAVLVAISAIVIIADVVNPIMVF